MVIARDVIQGAKGAHTPVDAGDTLRSTQRAEIVDLLGEGLIGGLVNGLKSVYLDGVPVENADGSRNFKDFAYDVNLGGPAGETQHAFEDVSTEVSVGITVLQAIPVVRTIADPTVDAVRITISVPQLVEQKSNGDRVGASFEWTVEVQSNGGGYVERHRATVSGKASSVYSRAVKINLAATGPAPWDIRVKRITADSTSVNLANAFSWSSFTALSGVRMLYRHSARIGITFDARNFSAVPLRGYDLMGISDWDIPVNYDPLARTVAGIWNGTFKQGWTNNPAWVLYNLVQNRRYGLGEYITALPDKWTLYQLAQWCDAPLPDGRGGTEPRYTVNAYIQAQGEALKMLQEFCAIFRGALSYSGGTLGVSWDAPANVVANYVPANVVDGMFTYSDGSRNAKKSSCTCWYNDRSQLGKRMPATWDDADLIAKYGMRTMEIDPIGVATPSQAIRMAKWALYTTEFEDNTVTFRVGPDGQAGRIGQIFQISDPSEAGERLGGRVHSATVSQVTLDAPVTLLATEAYTLWVTMADPTDPARLTLAQATVTNAPGTASVLNVSPPYSTAPMAQTVWLLEGSTVAPTLWRYVGVSEVRNKDNAVEHEITGLRHEPGKFALIEANQPLTVRPTRRLNDAAAKPTNVVVTETNYTEGASVRIRATVSWTYPAAGLSYLVAWRLASGPWMSMARTTGNTVDIDGLQPGLLEVQVRSVNVLGQLSLQVDASLTLTGNVTPPRDVTGLAYAIVPGGLLLKWDVNSDATYSKTRLSYGPTFASSVFFWEGKGSDYTVRPPADGDYVAWAVHVDYGGLVSAHPASLAVSYIAVSAGADGSSVYVEWSVNGATGWHTTFAAGDKFARWKTGVAGAWQGPFQVIGESGSAGDFTDFIFRRAATQPAAPTDDSAPNQTPAGWSDAPPAPDGNPLWASTATRTGAGVRSTVWSTPVRITGDTGATGSTGQPGSPGGAGAAGATATYAYYKIVSASLPSAPAVPTGAPTAGAVNAAGVWYASPPSGGLSANEWLFQASGTVTGGAYAWVSPSFIASFRVGNLAALSAVVDGAQPITVTDPSFGGYTRSYALVVNSSYGAQSGLFVAASSGGDSIYAYNASTGRSAIRAVGEGSGIYAFGINGHGIESTGQGAGNAGVSGTAGSPGAYGGIFSQGSSGFAAIRANGSAVFTGRINLQTSFSGVGAPMVWPVYTSKPAPVFGGVALHASYGLIVSDGVNWFATTALIAI